MSVICAAHTSHIPPLRHHDRHRCRIRRGRDLGRLDRRDAPCGRSRARAGRSRAVAFRGSRAGVRASLVAHRPEAQGPVLVDDGGAVGVRRAVLPGRRLRHAIRARAGRRAAPVRRDAADRRAGRDAAWRTLCSRPQARARPDRARDRGGRRPQCLRGRRRLARPSPAARRRRHVGGLHPRLQALGPVRDRSRRARRGVVDHHAAAARRPGARACRGGGSCARRDRAGDRAGRCSPACWRSCSTASRSRGSARRAAPR